jgi:type II secretory pathway pseudopilin PulG
MTLVEIVIALGVTGGLLAVALALAQGIGQSHTEQTQRVNVQENLRGALAQLTRDIRVAGAGMAAGAVSAVSGSPAQIFPVVVENTNPDRLSLLLPSGVTATTLSTVAQTDMQLIVDAAAGAALQAGDLALLTDYGSGVLYEVQGASATQVQGIAGQALSVAAAPSFPVTRFDPGALVLRVGAVRYEVQAGGSGLPATSLLTVEDGPPLGRTGTPAPVAEHIYDLQIAVGIDGISGQAQDGVLREVGAAANDDEWVFNVAGESLPAQPFALRALRVSVVGRTALPGSQPGTGRPAVEDRAAGAPDYYGWRVMTETVVIRNMTMR